MTKWSEYPPGEDPIVDWLYMVLIGYVFPWAMLVITVSATALSLSELSVYLLTKEFSLLNMDQVTDLGIFSIVCILLIPGILSFSREARKEYPSRTMKQ